MRLITITLLGLLLAVAVPTVVGAADADSAKRIEAGVDQLRSRLDDYGPALGLRFKQSASNPAVFTAALETGLRHADRILVIVRVSEHETLTIAGFPQTGGRFVSLRSAADERKLLRTLSRLSLQSFFFWGADSDDDLAFGFVFTLEDGMPRESLRVVLASIANTDAIFSRELRPLLSP